MNSGAIANLVQATLPMMDAAALDRVRALEVQIKQHQEVSLTTKHLLHGGVYARTIMIPAGTVIAGALIKIATTLIVHGDCIVFIGDDTHELKGYNVLAGSAGRKQAFMAITDTNMTMLFATDCKTIEACEENFTDEAELLISRHCPNEIHITGE